MPYCGCLKDIVATQSSFGSWTKTLQQYKADFWCSWLSSCGSVWGVIQLEGGYCIKQCRKAKFAVCDFIRICTLSFIIAMLFCGQFCHRVSRSFNSRKRSLLLERLGLNIMLGLALYKIFFHWSRPTEFFFLAPWWSTGILVQNM